MRVLGVDTSLRSTGTAVVEARGNRIEVVQCAVFAMAPNMPRSECLCMLHEAMDRLIAETRPTAAAVEGAFYSRNARTLAFLSEARGVVIEACTARSVPVYEYAPRRVKQAVVGRGSADKSQVRKMAMRISNLAEEPQEDAGDALALAICHIQCHTGCGVFAPKPI